MQSLPIGYYAVQCDFDRAPKDTFTFQGVTYAVHAGVNLFATLEEANRAATAIPAEPFLTASSAPVILFSAGTHCIDMFRFDRSLTLLGNGAGISPNAPSADPLNLPPRNPARQEAQETLLKGSFRKGRVFAKDPAASRIIFDGFSSMGIGFSDLRTDGGECSVVFRNMIYLSPCGRDLHSFAPAAEEGALRRELRFENIRAVDFYDYGYGTDFIRANAARLTLDGVVYDSEGQMFGLTDIARTHSTYAANAKVSEIVIRNSFFRNPGGRSGITVGCRDIGNRALHLHIEHTCFIDACHANAPVVDLDLPNADCLLSVRDCTFTDTRGNTGAAVSVMGACGQLCMESCIFTGFAKRAVRRPEPPTDAPARIEAHDEDWITETSDAHRVIGSAYTDFEAADRLYTGRKPYYGDLHVHTQSGGTSDGLVPIGEWPEKMKAKQIDFAAVVDHKQMRGFFLPEWDDTRFIIGTEPGTRITEGLNGVRYEQGGIHYIMLFPHKYGLAMVLANFPEFAFHGDELTGSFSYPKFTKARFMELTAYVQSIGGIMIHPHPKLMLASDDPEDYYIGEHTFMETLYESPTAHATYMNYALWVKLLEMGKHVYTSGGSDTHGDISNEALSTFYTYERSGKAFFDQMHTADFTVGAVGLQMCIDGHPMGSELTFREGMHLTLRMNHFFPAAWRANTAYEVRVLSDQGVAYASACRGDLPQEVELAVQKRRFYRAEVYDLTHDCVVAIGNPIWLDGSEADEPTGQSMLP